MELKPELQERLTRVLASVEQLLPPAVAPLDWSKTWAANWRRHSFAGYLEAVPQIEPTCLDDLVGIERQRQMVEDNPRQFEQIYADQLARRFRAASFQNQFYFTSQQGTL